MKIQSLILLIILSSAESYVFEIEEVYKDQVLTWISRTRNIKFDHCYQSTSGTPDKDALGPTMVYQEHSN